MNSGVQIESACHPSVESREATSGQKALPVERKIWTRAGWVLTGIVGLFMVFDGAIKLVPIAAVAQTLGPLGFSTAAGFERGLGALGLVCTVLFIVPRTSILGAILMTGYLGGAIASQLRVGNPLFSHLLFGAYLGLMAWGGLWLRMPALRRVLPLNLKAGDHLTRSKPGGPR